MLRKLAGIIYGMVEKHVDMDKTIQRIKRVYTCTDADARTKCRGVYVERISMILVVVLASVVLAVLLWGRTALRPETVVIDRPGYGGDKGTKTLETEVDGQKKQVNVDVLPIEYDESELEDVFDLGFTEIEEIYLGENESADCIQSDLDLPERLDDTGLDVAWISSDQDVVTSTGKLLKSDEGDAELVKLTAVLSYGEHSAEREYNIRVTGRVLDAGEKAEKAISDFVKNTQMENRASGRIELPSEIEGYSIEDTAGGSSAIPVIFLGIISAVCIWMGARAKLSKQEKERKQQLMIDYPELVDKLILYLGAGVTIRGSFVRMVQNDDESALMKELRYTLNEIQAGIPEGEAYYNMGHRINLPVYMKLMSMLSQNVSKGTKDIMIMMAGEEQAALQTRKELARKKGEEAGTRLLFPMIVLLGVVMVIVVLPAVMSF